MGNKIPTQPELQSMKEHSHMINCMAISQDQSVVAVGSDDCTISVWDTKESNTAKLLPENLFGHTKYITCLYIFDTFLISGSADKTIKKWNLGNGDCLYTIEEHKDRISRVLCTGDLICSTSYDHTAKIFPFDIDEYDIEDCPNELTISLEGHTKAVYSMIFIPDSDPSRLMKDEEMTIRKYDALITASADNTARIWSLANKCVLQVFVGHRGPVSSMTLDVSGTVLFTGSVDWDIRAWDIESGKCTRILKGHQANVVELKTVNRLLYSGSVDGEARCYVAEYGDCINIYKGNKETVSTVKFHNGVLYTGGGDSIIRAFDAKTGLQICQFKGHSRAISSLIVVDNKLFSGSYDSYFKVWDTTQIENQVLEGMKTKNNNNLPTKKIPNK